MGAYRRAELMRLGAVQGATQTIALSSERWESTLIVHNTLDAPIFIAYRQSPAPGATNGYDVACPGSAQLVVPIPDSPAYRYLTAVVTYPGAVPAGDAGLLCVILATEQDMPAGVGPLA